MMAVSVVGSGEVVIVLVELGLLEQRYQAVLEVLHNASTVTDVAVRFGSARQTLHRWLRRYAADQERVDDWAGPGPVVGPLVRTSARCLTGGTVTRESTADGRVLSGVSS